MRLGVLFGVALAAILAPPAVGAEKTAKRTKANEPVELGARPPRASSAERISLNLKDADLVDVLDTFHQLTGRSLVVYPGVRGTVTVSLRDVPWDQALDLILRSNGYGYVREGRVLRVGPIAKLIE